nr:J domain-containing protein [Fimbriiglobus ruber]
MAQDLFRNIFGGGGGPGAGADFGDFFAGGGGPKRGKGRGTRAKPQPETVETDISIPFLVAATGGAISISVGGRTIDVKVPAGIEEGKKLRVPASATGSADVYLRVHVDPHPYFTRSGNDVSLEVPIDIPEAVLGTKVEVPTLGDDRLTVKVPPGTSSGGRVRLRGKGINGGDQYLVFKIVAPSSVGEKGKALMEEFAELHPQDARANVLWK